MRILERIANLEDGSRLQNPEDPSLVLHSIIKHLRNLLNTRSGSVMIDEDYGIPEFSDPLGNPESPQVARLEEGILRAITKFEPRLTRIKIAVNSDDQDTFMRRFTLEAFLEERRSGPVLFETVVNTDGRIDVSQD